MGTPGNSLGDQSCSKFGNLRYRLSPACHTGRAESVLAGSAVCTRRRVPCRSGRRADRDRAGDAGPRRRRVCRPLLRDQEIIARDAGNLSLGQLFLPGEIGGLVLGVVLKKRQQDTDLEIFVRQLVNFGDAVSDQNCVVAMPSNRVAARVFMVRTVASKPAWPRRYKF